tara:strand:+ start:872 stop:1408 length:537 start_codon:yes stop_codon:yes gene_type:complete
MLLIYTVSRIPQLQDLIARNIGNPQVKEKTLRVVAGQSVKDGLTAKQEAFAQAVATGKTLSDAYRSAYSTENMKDSSVWTEASKLMDVPKVAQRVNSVQRAMEEKSLLDHARLKRLVLERLHEEATNAPSDSARIRALELLGKSIAMFTDRVEQDDQTKSSAELEKELAARLKDLLTG